MENQEDIQTEEIPDEFQCSVCLELLYKPVVLGCSHIACFWCIFEAMSSTLTDFNCPICRHSYYHFPSVCRLMHALIVKLYPLTSARRVKEVAEKEKVEGCCSPQFDDISESCGKTDLVLDSGSPDSTPTQKCGSAAEGEHSSVDVSLVPVPATSSSETNKDAISKNLNIADEHTSASGKKVVVTDLLCGICKLLLCRPVVLNCGHVYCETCVINRSDKLCKCPVCQLEHPNGFPNICLVLEHFLEEQFPQLYAESKGKRASAEKPDHQSPQTGNQDDAGGCKSQPRFDLSSLLTVGGPPVHFGVGCDYCGIYPIVGDRYKCKDCTEKIGFDLCEGCYKSSSKLPGRFNQQHRPEHQFEIIPEHQFEIIKALHQLRNAVVSLRPEQVGEDGSIALLEYTEDSSTEPQHPEEYSSETNSLRNDLREGERGSISSNDAGEDQGEIESANRD